MPAEFDGYCLYLLHSLRFFAVRDHCPTATLLSISVHLTFGRSLVLFAYAYAPHWCSLCPSALVHSCHMASPFPFETVSHCHDVLHVGSLPSFSIVLFVCLSLHTTCSILRSIFLLHVWSLLFSFSMSDHVWALYNRAGNTQEWKGSFLSLVFGIYWGRSYYIGGTCLEELRDTTQIRG